MTRHESSKMALTSGSDNISIKSQCEVRDTHENVPLKVRMKMLLASERLSCSGDPKPDVLEKESKSVSMPHVDIVVKKEDEYRDSPGVFSSHSDCFTGEKKDSLLSKEESHAGKTLGAVTSEVPYHKMSVDYGAVDLCLQNATSSEYAGMPADCNCQGAEVNRYIHSNQITSTGVNADIVGLEKVDSNVCTLPQHALPSKDPVKVKVEYSYNHLMSPLGDFINGSTGADVQAFEVENEIPDAFTCDDLDHIVLKERQRMLLSRKLLGLEKPVLKVSSGGLSNPIMEDITQHYAGREKQESYSVDGESSKAGNDFHNSPERNASDLCRTSIFGSSKGIVAGSSCTTHQCSPLAGYFQGTESIKSRNYMGSQECDMICSSEKTTSEFKSCGGQNFVPGNPNNMLGSDLLTFVKVKVEHLDNIHNPDRNAEGNLSFNNILPVKSELEIPDESNGDEVDHMPLRDRIKLLMSGKVSNLNISRNFKCLRKIVPSAVECSPNVSEPSKSISIQRPRKRKRTATDSVETALEEDAPGLLQVLIDKGVSVDEIKLYGEMESNEALDDSFIEDGFAELEDVISKLFSQSHSLLKFAPVRCTKGSKASYCLACLVSLVEQTRYLQFRKWPVEWGWCRDLQSFIFVFERHNRIVLERPEYGYATYFFELVDSLPIDWQIKRLVTAMKLTSCSRVTLIENKALLVGEDLTEGEARVLMEYGWVPNSGLGTMLNYCDRVVHDRKNERDSSEWRSKIGKLLMNGYNGGTIVSTNIPKKVIEYRGAESPQIKLEL